MQCWILFQLKPSQREKEHYVVISNEHSIIGAIPIDGSQFFYNMEKKEKYHPIGILIILILIAFLAYVTFGVISEGLMNIYNP